MSLMLMLDNEMNDQIQDIAPHKNMLDPNNPRQLTNVARFPKPVAGTVANWVSGVDRVPSNNPDKIRFLESLAS